MTRCRPGLDRRRCRGMCLCMCVCVDEGDREEKNAKIKFNSSPVINVPERFRVFYYLTVFRLYMNVQ